eukprot:8292753-Pyramimonas_sp.AAC.1
MALAGYRDPPPPGDCAGRLPAGGAAEPELHSPLRRRPSAAPLLRRLCSAHRRGGQSAPQRAQKSAPPRQCANQINK